MDSHRSAAGTAARRGASTPEPAHDGDQITYVGFVRKRVTRIRRLPADEKLTVGPSRELATHSREFAWGYGGSGPAQLSLALLLDYYADPDLALECYQQFCRRVVSGLATDATGTWRLTGDEIDQTVDAIREASPDG